MRTEPLLHYRDAPRDGGRVQPLEVQTRAKAAATATVGDEVVRWLTGAILGVCLVVWAVVGAVFWLPLLVRTMVRFSLALIQSSMDGDRPEEPARMLRTAVDFYRRGFVVAVEVVMGEDALDAGEGRQRRGLDSDRLLREVGWAFLVWYVVLALVGVAWSPVEIWSWAVALPWAETVGGIAGWFGDAVRGLVGGAEGLTPPVEVAPAAEVPSGA